MDSAHARGGRSGIIPIFFQNQGAHLARCYPIVYFSSGHFFERKAPFLLESGASEALKYYFWPGWISACYPPGCSLSDVLSGNAHPVYSHQSGLALISNLVASQVMCSVGIYTLSILIRCRLELIRYLVAPWVVCLVGLPALSILIRNGLAVISDLAAPWVMCSVGILTLSILIRGWLTLISDLAAPWVVCSVGIPAPSILFRVD